MKFQGVSVEISFIVFLSFHWSEISARLSCYVIQRYTECLVGSAISDLALRLFAAGLTCKMGIASGMPVLDAESNWNLEVSICCSALPPYTVSSNRDEPGNWPHNEKSYEAGYEVRLFASSRVGVQWQHVATEGAKMCKSYRASLFGGRKG
jgi:hypothetical protein